MAMRPIHSASPSSGTSPSPVVRLPVPFCVGSNRFPTTRRGERALSHLELGERVRAGVLGEGHEGEDDGEEGEGGALDEGEADAGGDLGEGGDAGDEEHRPHQRHPGQWR